MKYLYIFLISIVAFGCNNGRNIDFKAEQDSANNKLKTNFDTIMSGYGGYIVFDDSIKPTSTLSKECQKVKPLDWIGFDEYLGYLGNDTLELFAEFCQCGEFGGNREYILIYRVDTNLECNIIKDSASCHPDKYYRLSEEKFPLNEGSTKAIIDYLELLLRFSFMDKEWESNAAGYFSATLERAFDNRKNISMDAFDPEFKWPYFDVLKNELKNNR